MRSRAVPHDDDKPTDQPSFEAGTKTSQHKHASSRAPSTYALRIEYLLMPAVEIDTRSATDKPSYLARTLSITEAHIQPNWSRDFTVLGRHTLEQLNEIILHILGWDRDHLYEFRIADRVYAHLAFLLEDDLFVEMEKPCVSCDIPIRRLGLSVGDSFSYIFDFGDYNIFRITVLDTRPTPTAEVVPALLSYRGKNIVQYPDIMAKAEAREFMNQAPTAVAPEPALERFRVRFIRDADGSILREWRASNNKKNWQKAVAILENRNSSLENIAAKIERAKGNVEKWIKAFNRFGLDGLKKPDGGKGSMTSHERERRKAVRNQNGTADYRNRSRETKCVWNQSQQLEPSVHCARL